MNIVILLASGNGTRIKSSLIPKQFININQKPLFIHTLQTFIQCQNIDKIFLTINEQWSDYANEQVNYFFNEQSQNIIIVNGGNSRSESLKNAYLKLISLYPNINDQDIILTHDIARVLVEPGLINEHFKAASKYSNYLINTCINSIDTVIYSNNNKEIDYIFDRDKVYNVQTPQTLQFHLLKKIFLNSYDQKIFHNCDLGKLAQLSSIRIKFLKGSQKNFKVTTDFDLEILRHLI